jgi:hypothetical protein
VWLKTQKEFLSNYKQNKVGRKDDKLYDKVKIQNISMGLKKSLEFSCINTF